MNRFLLLLLIPAAIFAQKAQMFTGIGIPISVSGGAGTGTVTSVATTAPITGGTFTTTGTIACATCVTSAASLTSTAIMTGAGSQGSQTPSATSTLDGSGNFSTPGTLSSGVGSGNAGAADLTAGTSQAIGANAFGWGAGATMTTSVRLESPNAVPSANTVMLFGAPTSNKATWAYTNTPTLTGTNFTGIPIAGLTGLGTGVGTALAVNVSGSGAICLASGSACAGGGGYDQTYPTAFCQSGGTCITAGGWYHGLAVSGVTPRAGLKFLTNSTNQDAELLFFMPTAATSLAITIDGWGDGFGDYNVTAPMAVSYACVTPNVTDTSALSYTSIGTATATVTGGNGTTASGSVTWSTPNVACSAGKLVYLRFRLNTAADDNFVMTTARVNGN